MPIVGELLSRAVHLAAMPAIGGVLLTATLLVVSRDWRLNVLALAAQYLFVMVLMTRIVRIELAAVKGLIGWVICVVFYLTEQQIQLRTRSMSSQGRLPLRTWFSARLENWRREGISAQAAFGFVAAAVVVVTAYGVAAGMTLPEISTGLTLVCYFMAGVGILLVGLGRDPLRVGAGLLTFLSGIDLFYIALEPSLAVTGLFGSVTFLVALAAAYLKSNEAAADDQGGLE